MANRAFANDLVLLVGQLVAELADADGLIDDEPSAEDDELSAELDPPVVVLDEPGDPPAVELDEPPQPPTSRVNRRTGTIRIQRGIGGAAFHER